MPREKANWEPKVVFLTPAMPPKKHGSIRTATNFIRTHYYVGGNTKFYGAALLRLRERDFGEVKHYGGISPAWPLSYKISNPITSKRKSSIMCMASAVRLDRPPSKYPFPYPPVAHEPRIDRLA